jgi:hypothetical protein
MSYFICHFPAVKGKIYYRYYIYCRVLLHSHSRAIEKVLNFTPMGFCEQAIFEGSAKILPLSAALQ